MCIFIYIYIYGKKNICVFSYCLKLNVRAISRHIAFDNLTVYRIERESIEAIQRFLSVLNCQCPTLLLSTTNYSTWSSYIRH